MAQVLCTLPNASDEISGIKFTKHAKGMLSEDVASDVAARFASIPGYELVGADDRREPDESAVNEKAALLERAAAIGFAVKANWGLERLKAEVEKAEAAANTNAGGDE